LQFGTVMAHVP